MEIRETLIYGEVGALIEAVSEQIGVIVNGGPVLSRWMACGGKKPTEVWVKYEKSRETPADLAPIVKDRCESGSSRRCDSAKNKIAPTSMGIQGA